MIKGRKFASAAVVHIPRDGAIHICECSCSWHAGIFLKCILKKTCTFEVDVFRLINRICLPALDIRFTVGFTVYILFYFIETGSHYVALASLKFAV